MNYKNKKIEKALTEMGFEEFTEIQAKTFPLIEANKDVIGHSQTGTGKTAAFTLPLLEKIDFASHHIQAIIICPTRELAVQVKNEIDRIGKYLPKLKTVAVYGGESIGKQIHSLKFKPQIVVGTPGRTIDHIKRKLVRLGHVKYLVLDEADEMLKMGFIKDIEYILAKTNKNRQTVMFSATMPKKIVNITKKYMNNPELVSVVLGEEPNKNITQYYYTVKQKHKTEAVARLLHVYNPKLTLIFCNTKRKVDSLTRELNRKGYNVDKIHGDLKQSKRMQVLDSFHAGHLDILIGTDVAARGLDIKNVEVVMNYDVPEKAEFYVHRIGRTGRIGNTGYSFTFVSNREKRLFRSIESFTKSNIKKRNIPTPEKVVKVKQLQQVEEINEIIQNINTNPHKETAYELLYKKDAIQVVSALLHKLEKSDTTKTISGDINTTLKHSNKRHNRRNHNHKNSHQNSKNNNSDNTRYHLNVGKKSKLTPKQLATVIMQKTRLKNSQIFDISINRSFCFFTTDSSKHTQIMKSLSNITINNKRTSIQLAKPRR